MPDLVLILGIELLVVLAIIGFIFYKSFMKRLRALLQAKKQPISFDGYLHYVTARHESIKMAKNNAYRGYNLFPLLLIPIFLFMSLVAKLSTGPVDSPNVYRAVIIIVTLSAWLCNLVMDLILDVHVFDLFQMSSLPQERFRIIAVARWLAEGLKYGLLYVMVWIFFSILTKQFPSLGFLAPYAVFMDFFGSYTYLMVLVVLLLIEIVLMLAPHLFPLPFAAFISLTQPLASTQWADLEPRIAEWASLAGISFSSLLVTCDMPGRHKVRLAGLGHRPSLLLSETLLLATEWRVRDALICHAIAQHRARVPLLSFLNMCLWVGLGSVWLIGGLMIERQPASLERTIIMAVFLIGIPVIGLALYLVYEYRVRHPFESKLDRETIQLTGDPLALITAHHLVAAFDGKPLIFDGKQSEEEKRIRQLVTMGNQLWPRAPYASEPVPAVIIVTCNGYQITAPSTAVTEPAPVPIELYRAVNSSRK